MRNVLALFAITLAARAAQAQMDPSFAACAACHSVAAGQNRLGPSLYKIVGRPKASAPGFAYSPAMKAQKGIWSEAELNAFIANPRAKVPDTRMVYAGQPDPAQRARLITWLKKIK